MRIPALLLLLLLATVGCAATPRQTIDAFNHRHGGTLEGLPAQRARAASQALLHAHPQWAHARIFVLNTPTVAAYSWPNAEIYLTRGLLEKCDDLQLTAVIAHELGHLVEAQSQTAPRAFFGDRTDIEVRADLAGAALLADAGIPRESLITALRIVSDSQNSRAARDHLARRINILRGDSATPHQHQH